MSDVLTENPQHSYMEDLEKQNATMRSALEAIAHKITTSGKPRIEILNDCHSLAREATNGNDPRRTR